MHEEVKKEEVKEEFKSPVEQPPAKAAAGRES
jgi:hypothetical protein